MLVVIILQSFCEETEEAALYQCRQPLEVDSESNIIALARVSVALYVLNVCLFSFEYHK